MLDYLVKIPPIPKSIFLNNPERQTVSKAFEKSTKQALTLCFFLNKYLLRMVLIVYSIYMICSLKARPKSCLKIVIRIITFHIITKSLL